MPIANCFVTSECQSGSGSLIELWAEEAGHSSEHMTVNIVTGSQQFGNGYSVMATLYLPSVWSPSDVSSLQLGLARALSKYFKRPSSDVHVMTTIVDSGMVVEKGREAHW